MRVFRSLRSLLNRGRGITLLELLVVCLIFSVILLPLLLTLKSAYFSQSLSSQQTEVQLTVRAASEWLIKDLREAIVSSVVVDGDCPGEGITFNRGTNTIKYCYNDPIFTRTSGSAVLEFNNIVEPVFYTRYDGPDDPDNALSISDLNVNKKIIVVLSGVKTIRGTETISYKLVSQVKIRN